MKQTLIVLARQPSPGRCKRRLAASIGSVSAARVQQELLQHTLAVTAQWKQRNTFSHVELCLGHRQGNGGLGLRMQRQLSLAVRHRADAVVLVGSDLPGLTLQLLQQAFRSLHQAELVFGPAVDGGYWLVGMTAAAFRHQRGHLFSGITWGSPAVLDQTLKQADRLGLQPQLLTVHSDLDHLSDLAPWCAEA